MKKLINLASFTAAIAMQAEAEGGNGSASASDEGSRKRAPLSKEKVAEIRNLRSEVYPEGHDKAGKPVWTHKALAEKFGTMPGTISQIVRNRVHKDPSYTPVNDGQ